MSTEITHLSIPNTISRHRYAFIVLAVCLVLAGIAALVAQRLVRDFVSSWTMTDVPTLNNQGVQTASSASTPTVELVPGGNTSQGSVESLFQPTPVAWDGTGRVTVLLMGLDYRDWSTGVDVPRTDSMILLSMDPVTKTAAILSIPRDLWVTIPGMQNNKINTAYRWGEIYKLPDGPSLAMKTVEGVIGVPIQYYALVDFNTITKMIDELGGLDMNIKQKIIIDPIGPGNTIELKPGVQALTGAEVLAYARQRHTAMDDFDRSTRQQEVIMAIREQVVQFNMLPTLIAKAPNLYSELSSGFRTNLSLQQIIQLATLAIDIPEKSIRKGVFDPHKSVGYTSVMTKTDGKQDVLVPNYDQIRLLRDQLFATGGVDSPSAADQDLVQVVKTENARVNVLNGSSTPDLANLTGQMLQALGMNITGVGNAEQITSQTQIIDYSGKPYAIKLIIQQLKLQNPLVVQRYDPNAQVDLQVVLGQDWASQPK